MFASNRDSVPRSTELVFILDRSGSMGGLETDTIGGFNSMLVQQKALAGECRVTTVLFDDRYELLHDRIDLRAVSPISTKEYWVRGSTALLDAIGKTIDKVGNIQKYTAKPYQAEKVMVVIITDGMENASVKFGADQVRRMIERQKSKYGWEFIFLGANIDAVETSRNLGIHPDYAAEYLADQAGTAASYAAVSQIAINLRSGASMPGAPLSAVRADTNKRKARR